MREKALELEREEDPLIKEGIYDVDSLAAKMQRGYFKTKVLSPKEIGYIP